MTTQAKIPEQTLLHMKEDALWLSVHAFVLAGRYAKESTSYFQDRDSTDATPWVWAFLSVGAAYLVSFAAFVAFAKFEPEPFNDDDDESGKEDEHHNA